MKKILYIELSSGFGGSSEVLLNSLKYLDRGRFEPLVLVSRPGVNIDRIGRLGIRVIYVPFVNLRGNVKDHPLASYAKAILNLAADLWINAARIKKVVLQEKIDVVHINTGINIKTIAAIKAAGVPCVCHIRESRTLSSLEKYWKQFLNRILVLNQSAYDSINDNCHPPVVLVPDGLDLDLHVRQEDLERIQNDFDLKNKFCVGILGRLVDGKGQDDFIRAAAILVKKYPDVKFLIVGNDPDKNSSFEKKLRSLASELHIDGNLIFTGWRTDKNEIISVLDIVVQASSTFPEGFGLTCIEAMALHKPVVATDIPGPNSIVVDGVTGILVPPARSDLLAEGIARIIQDPGLASRMGQAGKERVEKHFDIKSTVQKVEHVYEEVLAEP